MSTLFGKPINKVIKHPGALTEQAKAAGKTISEFCAGNVTGKTAKRCALAHTLSKFKH